MSGSKHFKGPSDPAADPVMADLLKLGKPGERREGPTTFVGRVGLQPGLGFAAENERMKTERAGGMVLLKIDPKSVGTTRFANRHERSLNTADAAFKFLKNSIRANGQDTPIRVRPGAVAGGPDYEVVEGHRRHAAILELDRETEGGFQILARLDAKAAESKDLVLKMYRENAEREDLSAFETGGMFAQWLGVGLYKSQREIAAATGLHETTVGQYVTIAELPAELLAAFRDPRIVALRWSKALAGACRDRPKVTLARAAKLSKLDPAPDAEAVFRALTSEATTAGDKPHRSKLSESVKVDDKVLFTIALKGGRFTLNPRQIDEDELPALYEDLKAYAHKWLKAHRGAKK